jgi:hypothetical protein
MTVVSTRIFSNAAKAIKVIYLYYKINQYGIDFRVPCTAIASIVILDRIFLNSLETIIT